MAYTDPLFEARRKSIIAGTATSQPFTPSQPVRTIPTSGFVDQNFEKRRVQVLQNNQSLPPLTPMQNVQPIVKKPTFIDKTSKFLGISTGELAQVSTNIKNKVTGYEYKNIPQDLFNATKGVYEKIKSTIAAETQKQSAKEKQYKLDNSIPDYQKLDYDQIRDFSSVGMLKLSREDLQTDLDSINKKDKKNWLDKLRTKTIEKTISQIDETLALPPDQRKKKESIINGLAIQRTTGNLIGGLLGSLEGAADFITWRADVSDSQGLAKASDVVAKRINIWAKEVSPNNPELGDELLQGAGSTLAFYLPGAGVANASARLATISPKLATMFGVTAAATLEAATESGNTYTDMVEAGFSRDDADLAASRVFAGNIIYNTISDKVGLFSDAQGVKKVLTTALAEGSQEAFQDGLQAVNQKQDLNPDQLAKTFFIGAVVGGGMGSVIQKASTSSDLNEEDKRKLKELAEKIKKVENGADPEIVGIPTKSPNNELAKVISREAKNSLENRNIGIKDESLKTLTEAAKQGDAVFDPIKIRRTEEGDVYIEDGRHRLAVALENNIPVTFEDISSQYNESYKGDLVKEMQKIADEQKRAQDSKDVGQEYDYSSTQLDIPENVARQFTDFANAIPTDQVYIDKTTKGREDFPHITVVYGLDTANPNAIKPLLEGIDPIKVELGDVSVFKNDDYDVVKVDVISKQLDELNKKISELSTPGQTFDTYQPHITIAYVKKGEGEKYIGDQRFKGQSITLDNLTFSGKDGKATTLPLGVKTDVKTAKKEVTTEKPKPTQEQKDKLEADLKKETELRDRNNQIQKYYTDGKITLKKRNELMQEARDNMEAGKAKENLAKDKANKEVTLKSTDELVKHLESGGYRTPEQVAKLRADILKFGVMYPITIVENEDGTYVINDGNHRIQIAKDLGIKELPVKIINKAGENITKKSKGITSFPGVASGLATTGAEKISNFELRNPPKAGTEEFKLYKKVQGLIRKYAERVGESYTPRGALGVYFPKTKNIRVNAMNDLSVASHEITHFLDYKYEITKDLQKALNSKTQDDLARLYLQYYPNARETQQMSIQVKEGFATLLQKYVEMPTTITKEYPDLVKSFLKPGGKHYHEIMGEILTDLNKIVEDYQGLSSLDKIGSRVSTEATGIDKSSFMNFWQRARTQVFDKVFPWEVIGQKAKVGFTKEDPSLWLRAYSSVNGIVDNNISSKRGYWSFTNLQDGFQKKYDYNWKTLLDSTQKRGVTDSLGYYLVSRRQHFDYLELDQLNAKLDEVTKLHEGIKDAKEIKEIDRDTLAVLSEDYGIDVKELGLDNAKVKLLRRVESATKARDEVAGVLERDAFSREDVDKAYEENKERFKSEEEMYDNLVAEDLALLNNEEVQLIDKATYNQLKSKQGYASFKRQFYDELVGESDMPAAVRVGKTKVSSMISRKGSQRTIINPLLSALTNHSEILKKSMKQLVYNRVGAIGESAILPGLFQEIQVKAAVEKGTGKISFPQEKDPNIIMARKDYKRKAILTNSEVKEILDTLLTYRNIDTFEQLWTGVTRTFTMGTTGLYPQFALTNFAVDQITATANSFNKFKGFYSPLKEIGNMFTKRNKTDARYFQEYMVMGGERQTFAGWQRLDPQDLVKRIADEKSKLQHGIDLMQKGVDILSIPSAKSEILSRATEYMNARRAGKSQIVALEEAGRVTAPFHHIGAWGAKQGSAFGQTFIRGLPFFNASLQVIDQSVRTASTKEGRKRMTFLTIALTAAYLAATMGMMGASDDQKKQYHDLTADDLVNFIHFPNPSGEGLIRVKVANQFSVPGTVINMIIANKMFSARYGMGDALQAATAWLPTQLQLYDAKNILSWIPQIFKPIAYTVLNVKDYPKVGPLVSQGLQSRPPSQQYNEGTSAFAKKLGETLNLSPIKIDYLLTGYLGRASGFLSGKPGIYNPAASIMRDYYFTSGKSVSDYYEVKEKNDAIYSAYQNYEGKFAELPADEAKEVYRIKQTTDKVEKLLGEYRDMDVKEKPEEASEMRTKILLYIDKLNNGEKMSSLGAWSLDAKKRRIKNKPKK